MRKIKFRLWCENRQEWESDDWNLFPGGAIVEIKSGRPMNPKNHILEQFTGLLDCKGKEIYEGDILKLAGGTYEEAISKPVCFTTKTCESCFGWNSIGWEREEIEVIGNIHEGATNGKD